MKARFEQAKKLTEIYGNGDHYALAKLKYDREGEKLGDTCRIRIKGELTM